MTLLSNTDKNFTYRSKTMKFFAGQNRNGFIHSTHKKTKKGDYLFHVIIYYYDLDTGVAHNIKLGTIHMDKPYPYDVNPEFKKQLEDILENAEQTRLPFEIILDQIFT